MKMTLTNCWTEAQQTYAVDFRQDQFPDQDAVYQAAFKTIAEYVAYRIAAANRPARNVSDFEAWCEQKPAEAQPVVKGPTGGALAKAITDLLTFDGKTVTAAEFWKMINGEYVTLCGLADWIADRMFATFKKP